jgi:hypothetical protein
MADDPEPDVDELEPEPGTEPEPEVEPEAEPEADAEPETEPEITEPGETPDEVRTQERQPSRAEKRISGQQEALRVRDQQIADLNKRLDTVLAETKQYRQEPQETPAQREQRLALLDPIDRMRVEMQEAQNVSTRQMQAMAFTMQDSGDKATFDAKSLVDPLYAKWAPKVESFLSELRAKGQNVAREQALKYLIGEAALAGRKASTGKQKQEAAGRMTRNRTQPSNARSDTQVNRRGGSDATALERRLENVNI